MSLILIVIAVLLVFFLLKTGQIRWLESLFKLFDMRLFFLIQAFPIIIVIHILHEVGEQEVGVCGA